MRKVGRRRAKSSAKDSRFFTTTKKGEIAELREELNSSSRDVKVDAVKKVIAAMTVGKDVSKLFVDIIKCLQTGECRGRRGRGRCSRGGAAQPTSS